MNLCLQNFVYEKLLLISNDIIHPFLAVNSFRYLLELFSNELKQLLKTCCILFILKSIKIFTFSEREKCTKITFFMLLSFEGSFFMIIPAREDRNFLINMLAQSCTSIRIKIRKIWNILANFQNTKPFSIHIIKLYAHLRSMFDNNRSPSIDNSPRTTHSINLKK